MCKVVTRFATVQRPAFRTSVQRSTKPPRLSGTSPMSERALDETEGGSGTRLAFGLPKHVHL